MLISSMRSGLKNSPGSAGGSAASARFLSTSSPMRGLILNVLPLSTSKNFLWNSFPATSREDPLPPASMVNSVFSRSFFIGLLFNNKYLFPPVCMSGKLVYVLNIFSSSFSVSQRTSSIPLFSLTISLS